MAGHGQNHLNGGINVHYIGFVENSDESRPGKDEGYQDIYQVSKCEYIIFKIKFARQEKEK
jgi:hypothetical protein